MSGFQVPERRRFIITGVVQGVGFRPFVHRISSELGLTGFVGNDARAVFAEAQGAPGAIAELERRLTAEAPPLALITGISSVPAVPRAEDGFRIVASADVPGTRTLVPPDVATCDACLRELFDPANRRYRHPFITCTDCGPRFTIIKDLPYDRPRTTMAGFPMCDRCAAEYDDPADRRFHAQPVACHDCGPRLRFEQDGAAISDPDEAIAAAQRVLAQGGIVAVKGVGGYHLACRADCPAAVARLRERKARAGKPFALLARNIPTARLLAEISPAEQKALTSPARPIVLLRRLAGAPVAAEVAPGNPLLGIMLPYTPVHHLLLAQVPGSAQPVPATLVLTSANVSDEPLVFDDADAAESLPALADAVLAHDRPIHLPCDDSVVRVLPDGELPIRRSRGFAPLPVPLGGPVLGGPVPGDTVLGDTVPAVLAVGGELKNSACLIDGDSAFCSAHIGDMGNLATLRAFGRAVTQLTTVHQVAPEVIAADLHPAYQTRQWAEEHAGQPGEPALRLVQHHHAHVASLLAEHGRLGAPVIGVAFDGTGYGTDGAIWGGEILLTGADPARFERAGHLRAVALPGGDAAVRNPCRIALSYLSEAGLTWKAGLAPVAACSDDELSVVAAQLASGSGTVPCTSMGRLFDAVASLLGVRHRISYEAQAAIELEIAAEQASDTDVILFAQRPLPGRAPLRPGPDDGALLPSPDGALSGRDRGALLPVGEDGVIDYRPLIRTLADEVLAGTPVPVLARAFHLAVATAVAVSADRLARDRGIRTVGLTGGVFQNVLLTRLCTDRLAARGLEVLVHRLVPPNDGGLALGQAAIAALSARDATFHLEPLHIPGESDTEVVTSGEKSPLVVTSGEKSLVRKENLCASGYQDELLRSGRRAARRWRTPTSPGRCAESASPTCPAWPWATS